MRYDNSLFNGSEMANINERGPQNDKIKQLLLVVKLKMAIRKRYNVY